MGLPFFADQALDEGAQSPTVPGLPQNLAAESGDGAVRLTWEAPASNGGSAITGYEYRHAEGASVPTKRLGSPPGRH